ncbi:unnamed protein product, partial [Prorocentrum cordatum]
RRGAHPGAARGVRGEPPCGPGRTAAGRAVRAPRPARGRAGSVRAGGREQGRGRVARRVLGGRAAGRPPPTGRRRRALRRRRRRGWARQPGADRRR